MKALIQNNIVIDIAEAEFEVHPSLLWVSCTEECKAGWKYENGTFIQPEPSPVRTYAENRRREYPPITDYLDGVVKGDQAQIDAYVAACQAVKAKYPKA